VRCRASRCDYRRGNNRGPLVEFRYRFSDMVSKTKGFEGCSVKSKGLMMFWKFLNWIANYFLNKRPHEEIKDAEDKKSIDTNVDRLSNADVDKRLRSDFKQG
jgi:hypothetical protein